MRVLLLHGPNLNLLDEAGRTLPVLDAELAARATKLGGEVRIFQASSEGALLDSLHANREWAQVVVVNPGALAPIAWALADALELIRKPAVEVLLTVMPKSRGKSALADIVEAQIHGEGADGYLRALELAAGLIGEVSAEQEDESDVTVTDEDDDEDEEATAGEPEEEEPGDAAEPEEPEAPAARPARKGRGRPATKQTRGKTIGRKVAQAAEPPARAAKTIGRKSGEPSKPASGEPSKPATGASGKSGGITRALVRAKLADRLSGKLSPEDFSAWARSQWQAVRGGASVEPGHQELLEDVLLMLAASGRAGDHVLINYMTKLEA